MHLVMKRLFFPLAQIRVLATVRTTFLASVTLNTNVSQPLSCFERQLLSRPQNYLPNCGDLRAPLRLFSKKGKKKNETFPRQRAGVSRTPLLGNRFALQLHGFAPPIL